MQDVMEYYSSDIIMNIPTCTLFIFSIAFCPIPSYIYLAILFVCKSQFLHVSTINIYALVLRRKDYKLSSI